MTITTLILCDRCQKVERHPNTSRPNEDWIRYWPARATPLHGYYYNDDDWTLTICPDCLTDSDREQLAEYAQRDDIIPF